MKNLSAGQAVKTRPFIVLRYYPADQLALVRFQVPDYVTQDEYLPINLTCFEVSPFGVYGYCHPAHSRPDHSEHLEWIERSKNRVKHRLFDVICHLHLDVDFYENGRYKLTPIDAEQGIRELIAQKWDANLLYRHMETLKGRDLVISGHIFAIYDSSTDTFHTTIIDSTLMRYKKVFVYIQMPHGVVFPVPLAYINFSTPQRDEFDSQTRKRRRKAEK